MNETLEGMSIADPKISIGIVVYNGVEHIGSALKSVADQSYKNIEVIVVDGGSTDGTLDILEEYSKCISVMISEPDKGIYDAMNKVCSLATGDWLIFLGCDDELLASLGDLTKLMTDPGTVYYGDVIFKSIGIIYGGRFSKIRLMRSNICHQAIFYPKPVYKNRAYNLQYKWWADYVYNLQLMGEGIPFVYMKAVVTLFNDKGGSIHGDSKVERQIFSILRSSFGTPYALLGLLLRSIDKAFRALVSAVKYLLPDSVRKHLRPLWRIIRKIV